MATLSEKPLSTNRGSSPIASCQNATSPLSAQCGLTTEQARQRLETYGENLPEKSHKKHWPLELLSRFKNPLVLILLGAGLVSAFTGELVGFAIIFTIVAVSIALDFLQQFRADKAVEKLSESVSVNCTLLRDGKQIKVPSKEVVPGDIVVLSAGDLIPADGFLLQSRDFFLNQSLLTGESYPVEKSASSTETSLQKHEEIDLSAPHLVFAGSSVVSGTAKLQIINTGAKTILGSISKSLSARRPETSFEIGIRKFGMLIMRFTLVLVVFAFAVNVAFHRPLLQSLLFGVALAVGLTPELLPMVITVTLTGGALQMSKAQVIVKRLSAVQDLGSMEILCTDKTGTLTEGKVHLQKHVDVGGNDSEKVFRLAYINSYFETGVKSPLDDAILSHGPVEMSDWKKLDEVPFDFERRRVSVLAERKGERTLAVKGAPDSILNLCTKFDAPDGIIKDMDAQSTTAINNLFETLASDGFHILAIAYRNVDQGHDHAKLTDETELIFAGFAAFLDPPKKSAAEAIKALHDDNVEVKILTGDHELAAKYVCEKLDFEIKGLLTGNDINHLDDHALQAQAQTVNLFCRVNPAQKTRIITALKARGKIVGFLGDGINDAPSLHSADVGISVDTAVDVAKQAADMVLLKQDLKVLHGGIRAGRRAFANVQKYILMATSSNFGNMFSMALATLILPFLPMLPVQILLNNLLYDVSELALPSDNVDEETLTNPTHGDISFVRKFMLTFGPISSIFDFITFYVLVNYLQANEKLFHSGWFVESLATQILVIYIIRTKRNCFKSKPGKFLIVLSLSIIAIACLLTLPPFGIHIGFTPLPPVFYAILGSIAIAYLLVVEAAKHVFYRSIDRSNAPAIQATPY